LRVVFQGDLSTRVAGCAWGLRRLRGAIKPGSVNRWGSAFGQIPSRYSGRAARTPARPENLSPGLSSARQDLQSAFRQRGSGVHHRRDELFHRHGSQGLRQTRFCPTFLKRWATVTSLLRCLCGNEPQQTEVLDLDYLDKRSCTKRQFSRFRFFDCSARCMMVVAGARRHHRQPSPRRFSSVRRRAERLIGTFRPGEGPSR